MFDHRSHHRALRLFLLSAVAGTAFSSLLPAQGRAGAARSAGRRLTRAPTPCLDHSRSGPSGLPS